MKRFLWIVIAVILTGVLVIGIGAEDMNGAGERGGATSQSEVAPPLPKAGITEETAEGIPEESGAPEEERRIPDTLDGWVTYIKEDLLPIVVAILTVVAAIYVAISPILAKIKKASEKFKDATADVNAATGTVRRNKEQIEDMEARFSERLAAMEADSAANREELTDIKEMLRLGLGNMNELVAKGQARQILLLGKDKNGKTGGASPAPTGDGRAESARKEDTHEESSDLQA